MNILFVENDLLFAKVAAKNITRFGARKVYITAAPDRLFKWCRQGDIDLVLIDINLPGFRWKDFPVSGIELTRTLKDDPRTRGIPIILMSTYAMRSQKSKLLEVSKADYFWTKPISNYDKLIEKMEQLTEQNTSIEKMALRC